MAVSTSPGIFSLLPGGVSLVRVLPKASDFLLDALLQLAPCASIRPLGDRTRENSFDLRLRALQGAQVQLAPALSGTPKTRPRSPPSVRTRQAQARAGIVQDEPRPMEDL